MHHLLSKGVITDIFTANASDIDDDVLTNGPQDLPKVEGRGIDPSVIVRILHAVLGWDEATAWAAIKQGMTHGRDGETTIIALPHELLPLISNANESDRMRIRVDALGQNESELRADPLFGSIPDWVDELVQLCQDAIASQREIYLWISV